jgi:adenylyltransferase/sulfurtransferase
MLNLKKPRLPSHYYVRCEPPDSSGDEVLLFTSERRKIKLKGRSFREFFQRVLPLLDGRHSLAEIQSEVADLFAPADLEQGLELLAEHNLLQEGADDPLPAELRARLEPQLNLFHEINLSPQEVQQRLARATVAVVGAGGAGATAALALAAAHVGTVRCIDSLPVTPADLYLSPAFTPADVAAPRAEVLARRLAALSPGVRAPAHTQSLETDADVHRAVEGADFVLCCADPGQSTLFYRLNRVRLRTRARWTSCAVAGTEGVVGPTVAPLETACYLCYKMRAVACAENPEDEFAHQRFLDRRKQDDGGRRENLVFGAGVIGNLVGLEALKTLTGVLEPVTLGRIVVVDFLTLSCTKHLVLRKPWCPACFPPPA